MRYAASIVLAEGVRDEGGTVRAFDPVAAENAKDLMPFIEYCDDAYSAAEGADVLAIVTEWNEFRRLDIPRLKELMAAPAVVDCRNIYHPSDFEEHGFTYVGVGRGRSDAQGS